MTLNKLIAIDWSGRIDISGQRRHIYAAIWTDGKVQLQNGRTRDEITEWLISLARETPQLVVSIDCCFSFPAWFLREHGCATVFEFWQKANEGAAEEWLHRDCPDRRFWGKPHKRPACFSGEGLRSMYRFTDYDNKIAPSTQREARLEKMRGITPKSPFQIGGSGSVGTGSLRAMPMLARLHEAGFRVWPFESANLETQPLLVEMYTRLMTGPVAKSNAEARKRYLAEKRKNDPLYAKLPRAAAQQALASEDAFDALVSVLEMVRYHHDFATLKDTRNSTLKLEGETWRPNRKAASPGRRRSR